MKLCLIHLTSLWSDLLGIPPRDVGVEEAARAGASAAARLPGIVEGLGRGFERVVLVVDAGGDFRRGDALDPGHTERPSRSLPWSKEAWKPLQDGCPLRTTLVLDPATRLVVPPPWPATAPLLDLGEGECLDLAGLRPSARDVIATVAQWWPLHARHGGSLCGPHEGGRLRIVSNRATLVHLADEAAGIELVRSVAADGSFAIAHLAELRAELGPSPIDERALVWIGEQDKARRVAEAKAAGSRATVRCVLGKETAGKLVGRYKSAAVAVRMALESERPEGVAAPTLAVLREAGTHGGRLLLRALALATPRADVAIDVAALCGGEERRSDGEATRAHPEPRGLRAGAPMEGQPVVRRAQEGARPLPGELGQAASPGAPTVEAPAAAEPHVQADGDRGGTRKRVPLLRDPVGEGLPGAPAVLRAPTTEQEERPRAQERNETTMTMQSPETTAPADDAPTGEPLPALPPPEPAPAPRAPEDATTTLAVRPHTPAPLVIDPSTADWALALQPRDPAEAWQMAKHLHASGLFGKKFDSIAAIWTVMCLGREHGLSAMAALQSMHCIEGKVEMAAELIVAKILRSGLAKYFTLVETTDERATWETHRVGEAKLLRMTFTVAEAERREIFKVAGGRRVTAWGKPSQWQKMPDVMCMWRAATKLARAKYPDVVRGLYGQGEIRETRGDVLDADFEEDPAQAPQRRSA